VGQVNQAAKSGECAAPAPPAGPPQYRMAKEANLTVVTHANSANVAANFALMKGELNEEKAKDIVQEPSVLADRCFRGLIALGGYIAFPSEQRHDGASLAVVSQQLMYVLLASVPSVDTNQWPNLSMVGGMATTLGLTSSNIRAS